ncbi:hypothetical protein M8J76_003968 [Diaphorina citri]|nr:hypothetical protein M8J76_003968 [Diaphorina citri]
MRHVATELNVRHALLNASFELKADIFVLKLVLNVNPTYLDILSSSRALLSLDFANVSSEQTPGLPMSSANCFVQAKCFDLKKEKVCNSSQWFGQCTSYEVQLRAVARDHDPY